MKIITQNNAERPCSVAFIILILLTVLMAATQASAGDTRIVRPNSETSTAKTIPLDLETSLAMGINNNFELKALQSQKTVYDLTILERWRDFFPTLSVSYARTDSVSRHDLDSRESRLSFDSEVTLYDGGRRVMAYDVARLKRILARNDYRIGVNKLIMEITSAYLQVLQSKGVIAIYEKTLQHGLMQLGFIKREQKLGEATMFQVMEIDAKVKEVELNLEQAKDNYQTTLNQFKMMLRIDWRNAIEIIGDLDKNVTIRPLTEQRRPEELIAEAHRNRKEVESSIVEFDINKKTHTINQLYFLPRFSVGFTYSLAGDEYLPRQKEWGVSLKVSSILFGNTVEGGASYDQSRNGNTQTAVESGKVNILDSLDYKRKIVESKIEMDRAEAKKDDIRQQVALEVDTSYKTLQNYWKMISISQKSLELYDAQLLIERLKANMGESTRYDLMKKEIERGQAAVSYLESKVRYLAAGSTLELAIGADIGYLKLSKIQARLAND